MEEICKNIHDFCGSHNRNERMGGILLIRNLIDVVYADHDLHLQKLGEAILASTHSLAHFSCGFSGRYLQKIIDYKTDVKDHIPEVQTDIRVSDRYPTVYGTSAGRADAGASGAGQPDFG
eukprot:1391613-Amorphochlora_amoeboformis.AAC.1